MTAEKPEGDVALECPVSGIDCHALLESQATRIAKLRGALEVISEEPDLDSAHLIARRALSQGEAK